MSVDDSDLKYAKEFTAKLAMNNSKNLIGLHVGAGKPPNRWSLEKFIKIIEKLNADYKACFYITGSSSDSHKGQ